MKRCAGWLGIIGLLLLLTACDSRTSDLPKMDFWADQTTLTNTLDNFNYCTLRLQLHGKGFQIDNVPVVMEYDETKATLAGTGSNTQVYTDSTGYAEATFIVDDDAVGTLTIRAHLDRYTSVAQSLSIVVLDCPSMQFSTPIDTLTADGATQADLNVQLLSESSNIANQWIYFSGETGIDLLSDSLQTDSQGRCTNVVNAPTTPGDYHFTARMKTYPAVWQTIWIHYQ